MNDGRFASPIGTDKAGNFSCLDDERDVVDRPKIAVGLCQALNANEHRDTVRQGTIGNKPLAVLFFAPAAAPPLGAEASHVLKIKGLLPKLWVSPWNEKGCVPLRRGNATRWQPG